MKFEPYGYLTTEEFGYLLKLKIDNWVKAYPPKTPRDDYRIDTLTEDLLDFVGLLGCIRDRDC